MANFLVPFEGLSGINTPEIGFDGSLGQQLWGLVASIWGDILSGKQNFPLYDNRFTVSFDQVLAGYYFDPAADGSTDPSGPAYEIFNNIPGTGLDNAMPWSGETYTLQPWVPVREPPHR